MTTKESESEVLKFLMVPGQCEETCDIHNKNRVMFRMLTGPRSKLKNMSSSLPGIDLPNLALKES